MSNVEDNLLRIIQKLIGRANINIYPGTVVSVDKENKTCQVDRDDLPMLYNVRLNAVVKAEKSLTVYPALKSFVLCALIEGSETDAYLLSCSKIESLELGGKDQGGLVLIEPLCERLNKIETSLSQLINNYKTHAHSPQAPPFPTPPVIADPGSTEKESLENKIVLQ